MVAVNTQEGIVYGFRLMIYFTVVIVVGSMIAGVGGGIMADAQGGMYGSTNTGQLLLGLLIALSGILTIYAGLMGTLYKVIADAVERGNEAASD